MKFCIKSYVNEMAAANDLEIPPDAWNDTKYAKVCLIVDDFIEE